MILVDELFQARRKHHRLIGGVVFENYLLFCCHMRKINPPIGNRNNKAL